VYFSGKERRSINWGGYLLSRDAGTATAAVATTLQCATLFFRQSAPNTSVLAGFQSPLHALGCDRATVANKLCLSDLRECRSGIANWEEQFWVFVSAYCFVAPIHG